MRKIYVTLLAVVVFLFSSVIANGQLTGIKSIPADYATIAAAVTDLNAQGVGAGGVTFNVTAGHTEAITAQISITATGTAANPILFQKNGAGANPKITRTDAGSNTTSTFGGLGDGILRLDGSDYITFDAIDLEASNQGIEYGYYLHKPSATDACQFVTIKNCAITMTKGTSAYVCGIYASNGTVSVSSATGVTVSANSGRTENLTITGNTIRNVHAGINLRGNSSAAFYDQNVVVGAAGAGNTIENYGGGATATTYGVFLIYQNNPTVSYNTIDNAGGGGASHGSTLYAVLYSTVSGDVAGNNNTISLSNSSSASSTYGLYNGNTVNSESFSNNTFGAFNISSTGTMYLIYASNSTVGTKTITSNTITGPINRTGASGTFYCYTNSGSPGSGTEVISGNNFSNVTLAGTSTFYGINSNTATGHAHNIFNNTISNINGGSGTTYGINAASAGTRNIYGNTIHTLNGAGTIQGIANGSGGATALNIYKNKIYGLNSTSTATTAGLVTGILVSSGTSGSNANIYNNLIGNLTAPSATGTDAVRGISSTSTIATTNINLYYNSIYLEASSSGANFGTSGIFHTTSATATTANLTMRNNIIINKSVAAGTGVTATYRRSNTTLTNYNAASNNNLFYAGSPSSTNLIYTDGTNSFSDLISYQTFMNSVGADPASVTEDLPFQSTTGSSADFLKYNTLVVNKAESGGENVTGITDDYTGTIRQGNTGYAGTGLKPDIGAWELEGVLPSCSGTPVPSNTISSQNPACTGQNFLLSLDQTYLGVTYQWQSSPDNTTYNNIAGADAATLLQPGPAATTWYRCIITCNGNDRISTPVQVIINPALNGIYTINNLVATGGTNYNNFADAINDLNCRGISGAVTFNISAGQTFNETSLLNITFEGTAANTVIFQKNGVGANPKIVRPGTSATNDYVLRLTGADYITFDGIDIEQSGGSSADWAEYGIYVTNASITNGSHNNTFKNGTITLSNSNTNAIGVYVSSPLTPTAATGTNSNNRFLNMTVQNSFFGYRISGVTNSFPDNGNEINTEGGGSSIIQNLGNGATASDIYGVFASYQTGFKVSNTTVTNLVNTGTGFSCGLNGQASSANEIEFSGNTVSNITGGGTTYGIQFSSATTANIFNNTIHTISTAGTASSVRGIIVSASGITSTIYGNKIYNISSSGVTGTTAAGIDVATGLEHNIYNNMISDLRAPSSTTTTGGTRGISISGGSTGGVVHIYYNTVILSDVGAVAAYTSAGLHNSSTTPTLDIRNNIIINNSDVTTGTRAVAFWKTSATDNVDNNTNNNLYYAGIPGPKNLLYYDGTTSAQTIQQYNVLPAISPGESLSVTENVQFAPIVNGVLRPLASTPTLVESNGQNIPGYTVDFENTLRGPYPLAGQTNGGGTAPDLGADEGDFTFIVPALPDCPTLNQPVNASADICAYSNVILKWTPVATGGPVTLGYDVFFGTSPTPPFLANTSSLSYTVSGSLPNTTYYWKIVPKNAAGSAVGCGTYSFTTFNGAVTSTTDGTRCGPGTVNLSATGSGVLNWYTAASGGTPVATGTNFTTPSINTTTTYYVSATAGTTNETAGKSAPTGTTNTTGNSWGLVFDVVSQPITLSSVDIYSVGSAAGTISVELTNSSGVVIATAGPFAYGAGSTANPTIVTLPLNFTIPAGTGYRLLSASMSGGAVIRETSGNTYPYTSASGNVVVTSGYISGTSATYYWFYNWQVSAGCESPRVPVTATVSTPPAINASATSTTICAGQTTQLNVTSSNTGYTYSWDPGNLAGASQTVSPAGSTDYIVTATDNSGGPNDGCVNTDTVDITVNPLPSAVTVTPPSTTVCSGGPAQQLTASGGLTSNLFDFGTQANQNAASTGAAGYPAPYTLYYGGQRMQTLITAAELTAAGFVTGASITSIQFPVVSLGSNWGSTTTSCQNFQVSIGTTALTSISSFQSGLTQVVSPANFTPVVGYSNTHTFAAPFIWDGTSNVIIETTFSNNITGTTNDLVTQYNSPTSFQSTIVYRADGVTAAAAASATTVNFSYNARPDLKLNGTSIASITWSPLTDLFTDAAATIPYTGTASTIVYAKPAATTTYTATAANSFNCNSSGSATITVTPAPSATIAYAGSPYCSNGGTAAVTQTGTTGGTYSSTTGLVINSTTGEVDLGASTPGTYTVSYDIAASASCPAYQATTTITITPAPSATIAYTGSPYCSGAGIATVTLTGTTGGSFSSTAGLFINSATGEIDLGASTVGTYTVTYTIAAANGCAQYQTTTNVAITNSPSATIAYAGSPYCSNGGTATITQIGSTGGTYSSTVGLVINSTTGTIDLNASTPGTYIVTYSIAAGGGCSAFQTTTNVTITAAPAATISYAGSPYCSNGGTAAVTQGGTAGGTYSSTAGLSIDLSTGAVDLGTGTPGTYTVTYTVAAANGCAQYQTTTTITITVAPAAMISYAGSPYCSNGGTATVTQTGTSGGTYSSTAGLSVDASTGAVDLGASTQGTYTVTYTVAAANGCAQYQTTAGITINAAPSATISYAGSPYCSNGGTATVTQTGTSGGTYSSTAGLSIDASTGAVDLGASTPGTYTVTYTVAAANGCAQYQTTASITINAAPSATISYAGSPYCGNAGTATVTQTGTTGGTYSSTTGLNINATTGAIDLNASTPATYTVTYTIAAANGCAQYQTTANVTINAAPSATISYAGSPYCSNSGTATVTHSGTTGGTYSSSPGLNINSSTGEINIGASTAGNYTVTYTILAANGCAQFQTTANVTITAAPSATISYTGSPFCITGGTVNVIRTGTPGGIYSSTPGLSLNAITGTITLGVSTPGTYDITYTIPAINGCAQFQTTSSVTILAAGSWTGAANSDWNNAANWCGGIPNAATDVVIPSTASNMPVLVAGNGSARNITIANGASLTIGTGGTLNLYSNISGGGTFNAAAGDIVFRGVMEQTLPGFAVNNITMNGAGGVALGGNTSVSGTITHTNGNITLGSYNLSLANSSNGSLASHIITNGTGHVVVTGLSATQSRVVPVSSDATTYNPVILAANAAHTTDNFTVKVQQGVYENGISGSAFTTHVADRMWIINESTAGGSNVNITLQWSGSQELPSFDRTKCYVMQHNGTNWIQGTASAATGTDPYTQTKMNVTTFSPFAIQTQPIPRPITGIYPNPTPDNLNVVTDLLSTGPVVFSIYDTKGKLVHRRRLVLNVGLNLTTLPVSHLSAGVYIVRVSTVLNENFLVQRFVKMN